VSAFKVDDCGTHPYEATQILGRSSPSGQPTAPRRPPSGHTDPTGSIPPSSPDAGSGAPATLPFLGPVLNPRGDVRVRDLTVQRVRVLVPGQMGAQGSERCTKFRCQEFRLFPGREVSALSPRGRHQQTLDLHIEIPGDHESCLTPVGSDEARHRVVGQVHSISALVDEDRYRCV
jgi:hypothetical protein